MLIRVVFVAVGAQPETITIENALKPMQSLVGGYIEGVNMGRGIKLICNEDGLALNLPQNGCGILGPYFFTKVNGIGDNIDLTDEEIELIKAHVVSHRQIRHSGKTDFSIKTYSSIDEMLADQKTQKFDSEHRN